MDITENRRARLRQFFDGRSIPAKEKSYISQLMNSKAPFGEKAARRLENDYQMGVMYLDTPSDGSAIRPAQAVVQLTQKKRPPLSASDAEEIIRDVEALSPESRAVARAQIKALLNVEASARASIEYIASKPKSEQG